MKNKLKSLIDNCLKDRAILYSMLETCWRVLFAPISLLMVALKLTPEIQGFYYLFFSIAGMQQIIEAGFSHTIVQSISHEMEGVKFEKHKLIGNEKQLYNITQAMRLGFFWYMLIGIFCFIIILPVGYILMQQDHLEKIDLWLTPWITFIICFTLNLFLYPVNFFFEGILHLEKIYRNRLIIQISSSIVFIIALLTNCGIYSIITFSLVSFAINFTFLFLPNIKQFSNYFLHLPTFKYFKSIFKWQMKVSLVWCSGYFYWQLPTIIIFSYLGPIISGQYSMSSNIVNAVINIGQVFIKTKMSLIGKLRANNMFDKAYDLYIKCSKMSYATISLCFICFIIIQIVLPNFIIWNRMLPFTQTLLLFIFSIINTKTLNQAMFARCCKDEPYFKMSMFVNIVFPLLLISILHFTLSNWGIIMSIGSIYIVQYFWGNKIFSHLYKDKIASIKE